MPFPPGGLADGDLERVFRAHERRLVRYLRFRLGCPQEAEDAAQTAFLRLHAKRDTLRSSNVTALIYVTARNIATDVIRHRRRGTVTSLDWMANDYNGVADETPDAQRTMIAPQDVALMISIIKELPARCCHSFISYRLNGLSYEEIARDMGVTQSMVRKYVLKATAHCARRFEELGG